MAKHLLRHRCSRTGNCNRLYTSFRTQMGSHIILIPYNSVCHGTQGIEIINDSIRPSFGIYCVSKLRGQRCDASICLGIKAKRAAFFKNKNFSLLLFITCVLYVFPILIFAGLFSHHQGEKGPVIERTKWISWLIRSI